MARPSLPTLQAGWRTLVPLVVGGALAVGVASAVTAGASSGPPARSATALLADLDRVSVAGYSGTVVQKSTLLDPDLPGAPGFSLARLMSGTNTIKVWNGGPDRQRIAVLDATGETDLFRDGTQVWQWDSDAGVAVQSVASADPSPVATPVPVDGTTITPDDLARGAVAAIDPATSVVVGASGSVAGRTAYQLVLTPGATSASRIGRIVLWLDADTKMPLAAQVYARGITREPSIDLSFTQIVLLVPDDSAFRFVPPRTAQVRTLNSGAALALSPDPLLGVRDTTTTGTGWTRVAVVSAPKSGSADPSADDVATAQFGDLAVAVSGPWGKGKLLQTNNGLLSMLFVDDGRIVVGSVDPAALYAALS